MYKFNPKNMDIEPEFLRHTEVLIKGRVFNTEFSNIVYFNKQTVAINEYDDEIHIRIIYCTLTFQNNLIMRFYKIRRGSTVAFNESFYHFSSYADLFQHLYNVHKVSIPDLRKMGIDYLDSWH